MGDTTSQIDTIFDSTLPNNTDGFKIREGQKKLALTIANAMDQNNLLAVEAGTGTGKSFAYLVPALLQASKGRKVVVVTATIALQHQLAEKDIPHLQNVLGIDIPVSVLKGKSNYVCGSRFQKFIEGEESLLFDEEESGGKEFRNVLTQWVSSTQTGDREDFKTELQIQVAKPTFSYIPQRVWSNICTHDFACGGTACSARAMKGCHFSTARKNALKAGIIITNYNVLSYHLQQVQEIQSAESHTDATSLLPPDAIFVLDEAHKMKHIVRESMSVELSKAGVQNIYDLLFANKGIVELEKSSRGGFNTSITQKLDSCKELMQKFNKNLEKPNEHLNTINEKFSQANRSNNIRYEEYKNNALLDIFHQLCIDAREIAKSLDFTVQEFDDNNALTMQLQKAALWWQNGANVCEQFSVDNDNVNAHEKKVRFISSKTNEKNTKTEYSYSIIPLSVNSFLSHTFFNGDTSVVALSATMTSQKQFNYWFRQVGFPKDAQTLVIESPFDYKKKVQLLIPEDAPDPTQEDDYVNYLLNMLPPLFDVSKGRALVLCTSKSMVFRLSNELYKIANRSNSNWEVLSQDGNMSTTALSHAFREHKNAVLVGTASFWEGFDAPNDMLRLLVITRIPFSSPEDLLFKEEKIYLEQIGKNWFTSLAIPIAEIKLRQGFGRLMRNEDDGGVVIISDNRIVKKSYGATIMQQLPQCTTHRLTKKQMINVVKEHLQQFD